MGIQRRLSVKNIICKLNLELFSYLRKNMKILVEHDLNGKMNLFFTGILILILGGVLSLLFRETVKLKFVCLSSVIASILCIISVIKSQGPSILFIPPFGNVEFACDSLSSFFVIVISLITALASIYSIGYMKPYENKNKKFASHCLFLPVLTASMLLVVTVKNAFYFLILWEIMSLSSFFLVIFEDDKKEVLEAGIKYLVYMHISVLFIIAAFVLMSIKSGSYDFSSFTSIFEGNNHFKDLIFVLTFLGFGTKAGFFPMHNWLPHAHPAAPSHISAIMSADMINTGIYGILRVLIFIQKPTLFIAYFVLFVSVITALYGIIYALGQKDLKKLLAYSSMENIGIIGIAIAAIIFGVIYSDNYVIILASLGCFLHILNHSVFKSLLFMGAGSVYSLTHTKNIEKLGGLVKKMPFTAVCFLIACIAICALPPLNGFISEFTIYLSLFSSLKLANASLFISIVLSIAALALVGTLVILAMTKVYSVVFLGTSRSYHSNDVNSDVSAYMIIPMYILAVLIFALGISSLYIADLIKIPYDLFIQQGFNINLLFNIQIILLNISVFVVLFIMFILLIYGIKKIVVKNRVNYETWGCGYQDVNSKMQYSAASYVSPFTSVLTPLFKKISDVKKPKGFFPKDAHYTSEVEDAEEAYIINPIIRLDEKFLAKFERLQDGNIQHYILYGLVFLVLILIGAVFWG